MSGSGETDGLGGRQCGTGSETRFGGCLIAWVLAAIGDMGHPEGMRTRSPACAPNPSTKSKGLDLSMHGEEGYNFEGLGRFPMKKIEAIIQPHKLEDVKEAIKGNRH